METYSATITAIGEIAESTLEVRLEKPEGFAFKAGQFVILELPQMGEVPRPERTRSMSIASAPSEPELAFTMRIPDEPSAFKQVLRGLAVGDEVHFQGPAGHFTLPEEEVERLVFIAGGVGIAPFRSMILEEAQVKNPRPITLLYANRTIEQATYFEELKAITSPGYAFIPTLTKSSEEEADKYGCRQGYITADMINEIITDPQTADYYIVGTGAMAQAMKEMLLSIDIPKEKIHLELYPGY